MRCISCALNHSHTQQNCIDPPCKTERETLHGDTHWWFCQWSSRSRWTSVQCWTLERSGSGWGCAERRDPGRSWLRCRPSACVSSGLKATTGPAGKYKLILSEIKTFKKVRIYLKFTSVWYNFLRQRDFIYILNICNQAKNVGTPFFNFLFLGFSLPLYLISRAPILHLTSPLWLVMVITHLPMRGFNTVVSPYPHHAYTPTFHLSVIGPLSVLL